MVFVFLLGAASNAAAEVRSVRTIEPRAFGYFLGDTITRTVEIETTADAEVVPASLPRVGVSNYWLELRSLATAPATRGEGRVQKLTLTYQTFYAPIDPRKMTIPAVEIAIRSAGGSGTVSIPSFTFLMSPLREIFPEKSGETSETFLRPDAPVELRKSGGLRTTALLLGILAGVLGLLLAREFAWWPFQRRPARPFSRAAREVGRALTRGGADGYRAALLALHRAFDTAAGHRLFASDVSEFLKAHPEHDETRPHVERFFATSRAVFFGERQGPGDPSLPAHELRDLASRLAREERAAR